MRIKVRISGGYIRWYWRSSETLEGVAKHLIAPDRALKGIFRIQEQFKGFLGNSKGFQNVSGCFRRAWGKFHGIRSVPMGFMGVLEYSFGVLGVSGDFSSIWASLKGVSGRSKEDSGASQGISGGFKTVSGHSRKAPGGFWAVYQGILEGPQWCFKEIWGFCRAPGVLWVL